MQNKMRLSHAEQEYLTRRGGRLAKSTQSNYRSAFAGLHEVLRGDDAYLANVTPLHIERAMCHLENSGSYNSRLGCYRAFFRWCVRNGYIRTSPCDSIESRPSTRRGAMHKYRIPPEEWGLLLDTAEQQHVRDRALLAIGLYTGQRGSEYRLVRVSDVLRGDDGVIEFVKVKRSKVYDELLVPVFAELADELERWLAWYKAHNGDAFGNLPPNAYLLPARALGNFHRGKDGRIGPKPDSPVDPYRPMSSPGEVVGRVLRKAGWHQPGEGAHTLRRSIAAALYNEDIERGYDAAIETVQNLLGHSDSATTQGYLGVTIGRKRLEDRVKRRHIFRADAGVPDNVRQIREAK